MTAARIDGTTQIGTPAGPVAMRQNNRTTTTPAATGQTRDRHRGRCRPCIPAPYGRGRGRASDQGPIRRTGPRSDVPGAGAALTGPVIIAEHLTKRRGRRAILTD